MQSQWLRPIAGLLAFTGMRRSEVFGLRWLKAARKNKSITLFQPDGAEESFLTNNFI